MYNPKFLPAIDSVEIVDLRQLNANRVSDYMDIASNAPYQRLDGDSAQLFANAWRSLCSGMAARCHIPPIGFRFISDGAIVLEASVCWRCNNAYGIQNGNSISFEFDSECDSAQQLLASAKQVMGMQDINDG